MLYLWRIDLPINSPSKLRGTIRTHLFLLVDAYLFLHNCATWHPFLGNQSQTLATFVLCWEYILRLNRCASRWYLISSLNRCRPLGHSEKEGTGNSRREDRGTVLLLQQKGWRDKFGKGSVLSKIKISFGQTELLYLDPRGSLELEETKVVVVGRGRGGESLIVRN